MAKNNETQGGGSSKAERINALQAIGVALISGMVSLGVAYISTYPKITTVENNQKENSTEIDLVKDEIFGKDKVVLYRDLPIGTLLQSTLNFDKFCEVVSQPPSSAWSPPVTNFIWAPADGRNVAGSKYALVTGQVNLIDLRGVFVRALNKFDVNEQTIVSNDQSDPDNARRIGQLQRDAIRNHQHMIHIPDGNNDDGDGDGDAWDTSGGRHAVRTLKSDNDGGNANETRPKNKALYFYIKIN